MCCCPLGTFYFVAIKLEIGWTLFIFLVPFYTVVGRVEPVLPKFGRILVVSFLHKLPRVVAVHVGTNNRAYLIEYLGTLFLGNNVYSFFYKFVHDDRIGPRKFLLY